MLSYGFPAPTAPAPDVASDAIDPLGVLAQQRALLGLRGAADDVGENFPDRSVGAVKAIEREIQGEHAAFRRYRWFQALQRRALNLKRLYPCTSIVGQHHASKRSRFNANRCRAEDSRPSNDG